MSEPTGSDSPDRPVTPASAVVDESATISDDSRAALLNEPMHHLLRLPLYLSAFYGSFLAAKLFEHPDASRDWLASAGRWLDVHSTDPLAPVDRTLATAVTLAVLGQLLPIPAVTRQAIRDARGKWALTLVSGVVLVNALGGLAAAHVAGNEVVFAGIMSVALVPVLVFGAANPSGRQASWTIGASLLLALSAEIDAFSLLHRELFDAAAVAFLIASTVVSVATTLPIVRQNPPLAIAAWGILAICALGIAVTARLGWLGLIAPLGWLFGGVVKCLANSRNTRLNGPLSSAPAPPNSQ